MSLYKFRPYYLYNGISIEQPFREELTPEEVEYNKECFFNEVERYFENVVATFEKSSDGFIEITSEITQDDCDERVKRCLNNLDLYAEKIAAE